MTNKELTELMIKQLLHEWKRTKSTATAYDICNTLCEYFNINEPSLIDITNDKELMDRVIKKSAEMQEETLNKAKEEE